MTQSHDTSTDPILYGHIDLVETQGCGFFVLADDRNYENFPKTYKKQLTPRWFVQNQHRLRQQQAKIDQNLSDSLQFGKVILAHYWTHGIDIDIVDVGAYVGQFSIPLATFAVDRGQLCRIHCFEPGATISLLKHNVALNRIDQCFRINPIAVSDFEGPALLYVPKNANYAARIYKPQFSHATRLCTSVSGDAYFKCTERASNLLIKIDTEGEEARVLRGFESTLAYGINILIIEFRPWLLNDPGLSVVFARLLREAIILDVGRIQDPQTPVVIAPDRFKVFCEKMEQQSTDFRDLLIIPRSVPMLDRLIETLTGLTSTRSPNTAGP